MSVPELEQVIKKAASNWRRMLRAFHPAVGNNGFHERNLTFQFAQAFLQISKRGSGFMEIPFVQRRNTKQNKHIDGYLFNEEMGVLPVKGEDHE